MAAQCLLLLFQPRKDQHWLLITPWGPSAPSTDLLGERGEKKQRAGRSIWLVSATGQVELYVKV